MLSKSTSPGSLVFRTTDGHLLEVRHDGMNEGDEDATTNVDAGSTRRVTKTRHIMPRKLLYNLMKTVDFKHDAVLVCSHKYYMQLLQFYIHSFLQVLLLLKVHQELC